MSLTKKTIDLPEKPTCSTFSVDGNYIYFGLRNGDILIVDVNSLKVVKTVEGHNGYPIRDITCSNNGNHIATASYDNTIKIWNTSSFKCVQTLTGHTSNVLCCAFSPIDNNILISGSKDESVRVWNISSGKCVKTIQDHTRWVRKCKFSNDGLLFASCSGDNTIKVWNASTYECVATLNGHTSYVLNCIFNNTHIISVSADKSIKVWSLQSFQCIKTIENAHNSSIFGICSTVNNKYIFTGSKDKTMKVWNTDTWTCVETIQSINEITNISCNQNCSSICVVDCDSCKVEIWTNTKYDITVFTQQQIITPNINLLQQEINDLKTTLKTLQSEHLKEKESKIQECLVLSEELKQLELENQKLQQENSLLKNTTVSTNQSYLIEFSQLKVDKEKLLGAGSFGKVYEGSYFKLPVAVKKLKTGHNAKALEDFQNEMQTLMTLKHSQIVSCFGCSMNDNPVIVLELMSQSLQQWLLKQASPVEEKLTNRILYEISLGMHYLHSYKPMIIHRDLKSLNILLDNELHAKVTDFGLAKTKSHTQSNTNVSTLGTIPWTAPEYLTIKRRQERNEKGDVFSFGVIVWELVTRKIPWNEENFSKEDVMEATLTGERLTIPKTCPEHLREVMSQCWNDTPAKRPSFEVLIEVFKKPLVASKVTKKNENKVSPELDTEERQILARLQEKIQNELNSKN